MNDQLVFKQFKISNSAFTLRAQFNVSKGEVIALTGRSGGGKSTLLKAIAGILSEQDVSGEILLNGVNLRALPPEKREIGFQFQQAFLFPHLNVTENIAYPLKLRNFSKKERNERALESLRKIGLESLALKSINGLSGGEMQRISFLRTLIFKPKLLLLDEPFSALDEQSKQILIQDLKTHLKDVTTPALIVTHNVSELSALITDEIKLKEDLTSKERDFVR